MPKKHRKMLTDWQAPYILPILRLIETQSKTTIANWCIDYAQSHILPIYQDAHPTDSRPALAIDAALRWLAGEIKLPEAKRFILDCHQAAREVEDNPAALAAARTIGQCAATIHTPTHSAGLMFYGALAIAYHKLGTDADWEELLKIAEIECNKMEQALRDVAVEDEPNPAKINWNC
ncbi:MAG: hypothetical protein FWB74_02015 [Defluviitaleaceae bacterium]|nr:hypothetical protein [Defluviitaleaceae bacterium]